MLTSRECTSRQPRHHGVRFPLAPVLDKGRMMLTCCLGSLLAQLEAEGE